MGSDVLLGQAEADRAALQQPLHASLAHRPPVEGTYYFLTANEGGGPMLSQSQNLKSSISI